MEPRLRKTGVVGHDTAIAVEGVEERGQLFRVPGEPMRRPLARSKRHLIGQIGRAHV